MKRVRVILGMVLALLVMLESAHAAVTWTIVTNNDCTALGAATGLTTANVNCCTGAKSGFCDQRGTALGTEFSRIVYAVTSTGNTYTTGGDAIAAAQVQKLGFGTPVYAVCNPATTGSGVVLVRTATLPKVQLFDGAAEKTGAGAVNNVALNCIVFGH